MIYLGDDIVYGDPSRTVNDIWWATVYSFEACMDSCAQYNIQRPLLERVGGKVTRQCAAISYHANLTDVWTEYGESKNFTLNCILTPEELALRSRIWIIRL